MAQKYTIMQKVALGVFAVCAVFIVGLVVAFGDDYAARERQREVESEIARNCSDRAMAYIMSRRFIERELKTPSTAKFPSFHDEGVHAAQAEECKFRVSAYVDAQNSFGAMIRTRYTIDMEYLPGDRTWRGTNLQM